MSLSYLAANGKILNCGVNNITSFQKVVLIGSKLKLPLTNDRNRLPYISTVAFSLWKEFLKLCSFVVKRRWKHDCMHLNEISTWAVIGHMVA
jgi:hypothetical protein